MMRKFSISLLLIAILMAIPGHLLRAQENPRTSKVLAPVNDNQVVLLKGHLVPWATSANDVGAVPDNMSVRLHVMLKRSAAQDSAVQKLLAEQLDPDSANYHKWLKPEEYGARFGASDADLAKVAAWLTAHGFTVDKVAKGGNIIRFSGNGRQVREGLHTQLRQYMVDGEVHYANASEPAVPAALAPVIAGFVGLNDMAAKPLHSAPKVASFSKKTKVSPGAMIGVNPQFSYYDPQSDSTWALVGAGDWATIYNTRPITSTYDGTGTHIAIVAQSDLDPKDFDDFRAAFGMPKGKLNILYDGRNPGRTGGGAEIEGDLDMEWAGVAAPGATIDVIASENVANAIFYAVENDVAPVLSISWGACEFQLGSSNNLFFSEMYQQAAAQGITVVVAAGDQGSSCDRSSYSVDGLGVSGFGSTPYNVAVGGTDFSVNILGDASAYWNTDNDANLTSAKSYIPETPWNESCGSPQVLEVLQNSWGLSSITTAEELCNYKQAERFLNTGGGGGGVSNCIDADTGNPADCKVGYPQPGWQKDVPGVAADGRRHMPDVSFFSGSGLYSSGLLFCASTTTPSGGCKFITDENGNDDVMASFSGGTSFAAPAFAGVVALLNEKAGSRLGNINYALYRLAAEQFNGPSKSACQTDGISGITGSESCIFHDITLGSNAVPCAAGSPDNPPDGKCTPSDPSDKFGVLSGYSAGVGYDNASGLGSLNVANLVNSWPDSLGAATETTLTLASSSVSYGALLRGTVTVTSADGTPTGPVTLMYKDANGNPHGGSNAGDLNKGAANVETPYLAVGTYKVYARYGGDGTHAASVSAEQSVTISQTATSLELTANRTSVGELESAQLVATIKSSSIGDPPTGSVVFKNVTTGAVLDTVGITTYTDDSTGHAYARALITAGADMLTHGSNQITATYVGDTNYGTSTASGPAIQYNGGFSIAASSTSVTLSPGATSGNTVVFTLTPSSGATLSPSSIQFTCPGTLPAGVACQFSTATAGTNGTVNSTLAILLTSPLAHNSPAPLLPNRGEVPTYLAMMILGGVFLTVPRKRSSIIAMSLVLMVAFTFGCGSSSHKTPPPASMTVNLSASNAAPALNSAVTLNATLSNSAATGAITFFDGAKSLGSVAVSNGAASLTTSSLPVGARTITAKYSGDATYPAATSAPATVDVTYTSTITAQAVDTATGNFSRQSVTFTVK